MMVEYCWGHLHSKRSTSVCHGIIDTVVFSMANQSDSNDRNMSVTEWFSNCEVGGKWGH